MTEKLTVDGLDNVFIEGLESVFEEEVDPFTGLDTLHEQEKYFWEKLGLVVSNCICLIINRNVF